MSPIIDIQRRLAQTGRIRIGEVVHATNSAGKAYTRPKKSETFRLTSSSEAAINAVASKYGGTPTIWADAPVGKQWELMTTSTTLDILLPPESMSFSQYYELWSGGGCQRRCNGAFQVPSEDDCVCNPDARECKPHTRLSVMLADLPGAGLWRLDTQGWNAANEMNGAFELAELISRARGIAILPGVLRLDQRETKRPDAQGKPVTRKFAVPVIDFDLDLSELARGTQVALAPAPSGLTPIRDDEVLSTAQQLEQIEHPVEKVKRSNSAEPVKPTGVAPRPRGVAPDPDEEFDREFDEGHDASDTSIMATDAQREDLARILSEVTDDDKREAVREAWKFQQLPPVTKPMTIAQLEAATRIIRSANPQVEPTTVDQVRVNADDILPPRAARGKITQLNIKFEECGFGDREIIHAYCAKVIGIPNVKTLNDLTKPQVDLILQQLVADANA